MPAPATLNLLLKDFSPSTKEQWRALAKKELGDQDPFDTLTQVTTDGLHVKPYYDKTDLNNTVLQGFQLAADTDEFKGARTWENLPPVHVNDELVANKKALEHLVAGADGIVLDLTKKKHIDFDKLLNGIALEYCNVSFITMLPLHLSTYFDYLDTKQIDKRLIDGTFFWKDLPKEIFTPQPFSKFQSYGISISPSTPVDEIRNALVNGNQFIQRLTQDNWKIEEAISSISFSMGVETDFFTAIAKLKTMRFLWFQVAHAYGLAEFRPEDLYLHAHSHAWINSDFQPHGNMLKGTTVAMAAVLGGANRISVYPENIENEVMSRIARNTSHILREESYLNKVADPLAGCYLVENLMMEMAEKAWAKFQSAS